MTPSSVMNSAMISFRMVAPIPIQKKGLLQFQPGCWPPSGRRLLYQTAHRTMLKSALVPSKLILVTGATGFVGRALLPRLAEAGHNLRVLLRPSRRTPRLPKGVPVEVAIAQLDDQRGLATALSGVDTVIHLAGA